MGEMIVAVAGDWHGGTEWARRCIDAAAGEGVKTLLHQGDFGIWPGLGGRTFLDKVTAKCAERDIWIYVTPGNHEDWGLLTSRPTEQRNAMGELIWLSDRVAVLPRGHRFQLGGRSFVSLGGAPSVDFESRYPGRDWWPEELATEEDISVVIAGGHAEIMLAHDSPDAPWQTGKVEQICANNPLGLSSIERGYAAVGRDRITEAFRAVEPRLYLHGHYHVADTRLVDLSGGQQARIVSLAHEWQPGNLVYLDLETLNVRS